MGKVLECGTLASQGSIKFMTFTEGRVFSSLVGPEVWRLIKFVNLSEGRVRSDKLSCGTRSGTSGRANLHWRCIVHHIQYLVKS